MLRVFFHLTLDSVKKHNGFSITFPKKSRKFLLYEGGGLVSFDLRFMVLPAEDDPIPKKES